MSSHFKHFYNVPLFLTVDALFLSGAPHRKSKKSQLTTIGQSQSEVVSLT